MVRNGAMKTTRRGFKGGGNWKGKDISGNRVPTEPQDDLCAGAGGKGIEVAVVWWLTDKREKGEGS